MSDYEDYFQSSRFGEDIDSLCEHDEMAKLEERLEDELGRVPTKNEAAMGRCNHVLFIAGNCENRTDAGYLRGVAIRALESYPDHPNLLLLRAFAECLSETPSQQAILEDGGKAISLLAKEIDDDSIIQLAASSLFLLETESEKVRNTMAEVFFNSMESPRKTARKWTKRNEKVLQDAGTYYLDR